MLRRLSLGVVLAVTLNCGKSPVIVGDGGTGNDAGVSSSNDAGQTAPDAGQTGNDAGQTSDAGPVGDGGEAGDGGESGDGGEDGGSLAGRPLLFDTLSSGSSYGGAVQTNSQYTNIAVLGEPTPPVLDGGIQQTNGSYINVGGFTSAQH
jgi:hypothetical protein